MTIAVKSSAPVSALRGPTDFVDVMAGADQPVSMGDDWFNQFSSSASVNVTENQLAGNVNRGASGLTFGPAQMVPRVKFFPIPIDHKEVRRQSLLRGQRSKWTHVQTSSPPGGTIDVGVMVFGESNRGQEYWLNRDRVGDMNLYRNYSDGPGSGTVLLLASVFNAGVGDSYEIRAFYAPGANTIQCLKNDVVMAAYVDSSAQRPAGGMYGLMYFGNGAGSNTQTYRDYSGGVV